MRNENMGKRNVSRAYRLRISFGSSTEDESSTLRERDLKKRFFGSGLEQVNRSVALILSVPLNEGIKILMEMKINVFPII